MTTIHVDFNDIENDDRISALLDHADGEARPGHVVELRDGDENRCMARVNAINHALGVVYLRIRWATWNVSLDMEQPREGWEVLWVPHPMTSKGAGKARRQTTLHEWVGPAASVRDMQHA